MTEYEKLDTYKKLQRLMLSPEGRTFGRVFTTERNKEGGDFVKLKREINDIFNKVVDDLYLEAPPTQL